MTPYDTKVQTNKDFFATKQAPVLSYYHNFNWTRGENRDEHKRSPTYDHEETLGSVVKQAPNLVPKKHSEPTESDVLLGRGARVCRHPGNIRLRELADSMVERYRKGPEKDNKTKLSEELVENVHVQMKGKFLKLDNYTKQWYEVGHDTARVKCDQVLRGSVLDQKRCEERLLMTKTGTTLMVDLLLPEDLTSCDVLLGPDSVRANHSGTLRFHKLLKQYLPSFVQGSIAPSDILRDIRDWGGRFYARRGSGWRPLYDSSILTPHVQRLLENMKFIVEKRGIQNETGRGDPSDESKWLSHFEKVVLPHIGDFDVLLGRKRSSDVSTPGNHRFRLMMERHYDIFKSKDYEGRKEVAHFILNYFLANGANFYLPQESLGACHREIRQDILADEIVNHFPLMDASSNTLILTTGLTADHHYNIKLNDTPGYDTTPLVYTGGIFFCAYDPCA